MNIKNSTVLITGASKGIGKALKELFQKESINVIGTYHNTKSAKEKGLLELSLDDNTSINIFSNKCKEIVDPTKDLIIINNAGIGLDIGENNIDLQKLQMTINTNLLGTIGLTEGFITNFSNLKLIINVTSIFSLLDNNFNTSPAYSISKAALNFYTVWLSKTNLEIMTIGYIPGWTKTDMGGYNAENEPDEIALDLFNLLKKPDSLNSGSLYIYKEGEKKW